MKKLTALTLVVLVLFAGCNKDDLDKRAPALPPAETLEIDFSRFAISEKSAAQQRVNWIYSATTVGIWNVIIGTTFAVPVASFRTAVKHEPVKTGDNTWQWQYDLDGFASRYTARLTGTLESGHVKWEMYISKEGIHAFDEFLWFEGESKNDGKSGWWLLYHSHLFPDETVRIDWKLENEGIGEILYTYVRETNNEGLPDPFKGSTLRYGLQLGAFDAYVQSQTWDNARQVFNDTHIEWSRKNFSGRVKSQHFYKDSKWHCWDEQGYDLDCE